MNDDRRPDSGWPRPAVIAFVAFAAIAGYFLIAEHRAHVITFLPWLLLAACPLMHLFMHHGHGGHGGHGNGGDPRPRAAPPDDPAAPGAPGGLR